MLVSAHPTRHTLLRLPHTRLAALRALASRTTAQRGMADVAAAAANSGSQAPAATRLATAGTGPGLGDGGRPKVLILTGPTAVGKTKASLALAAELGGEIISADSVQVYRGLDVGSDKASAAGC